MILGNSLDYKTVDRINQRKDNPTGLDKLFARNYESRYLPKRYGHRKYNHEPFFNVVEGYRLGGTKGIQAMFLHDIEDMISDELVNYFGSDGRNIFEAIMNYSFSQHRKYDRNRRSAIRKMY